MAEFYHHQLLADPLVAVVGSGSAELWPGIAYSNMIAKGGPGHVMIYLSSYLEKHLPRMIATLREARRQFENLRFTILAATPEDEDDARAHGLDAFVCNHNCFLNERLIYPEPNVAKIYDAVYTGRLHPTNRYELAAQVTRLAVITSNYELEVDYAASVLAGMSEIAQIDLFRLADASMWLPQFKHQMRTQINVHLGPHEPRASHVD